MKLVVIFIVFGFLFGLFAEVDSTGRDIPYSMMLNLPTLYAQRVVSNTFDKLEEVRVKQLREKLGTADKDPFLTDGDTFNKRKEFISGMVKEKSLIINDPLIGEKGTLYTIRNLISFPILSAFTWGLMGFVIFIILRVKKKVSATKTD